MTVLPVSFHVEGVPAPQGSKKIVRLRNSNRTVLIDDNRKTKPWRERVRRVVSDLVDGAVPIDHAVEVIITFRLPMPSGRRKATRDRGWAPKIAKPDLDKLQRAIGDALTEGGLIRDDSLVWRWVAEKIEVTGWTGVTVQVLDGPPV